MASKVGKGKLWLDGSGRVTVPFTADTRMNVGFMVKKFKILVLPEDKVSDIWEKIGANKPTFLEVHELSNGNIFPEDERFAMRVLQSAQRARQDPKQLAELEQAVRRTQQGADKSRRALMKRLRSKKETSFKRAAQDLMTRGLTKAQLFQLIREAIVEEVHEG